MPHSCTFTGKGAAGRIIRIQTNESKMNRNREMERKPITQKQMRWQIALQVLTLILACISIWISKSMVQKVLGGILVALAVYAIVETILRWKRYPIVDTNADEAFMEEKKSAWSAMLSTYLILGAVIFFIVMAIRAF